MQVDYGGAVYLRLSTSPLVQPDRSLDEDQTNCILAGGYWRSRPSKRSVGAIVYMGAIAPEAEAAHAKLAAAGKAPGLLAITSADRLYTDWQQRGDASHIAQLLVDLEPGSPLVTVLDGHPATLSWLAGVCGHRNRPLGVNNFGQCGDIPTLYSEYGLDTSSICAAYHSLF